jgi:hypothetical protein
MQEIVVIEDANAAEDNNHGRGLMWHYLVPHH